MPARAAINRFHRDLTVSSLLKWSLLGVALACVLWRGLFGGTTRDGIALVAVGAVWVVLGFRSVRGSRLAADSSSLIASGDFDAAERHLDEALRAFSIFRNSKLLSLHHLAVLRHAQRRWHDAAELARALLRQRLGPMHGLDRPTRLILAESLLEIDDLPGAHAALSALYSQRLLLGEALMLLAVQLDYMARVGAWDQMVEGLETKLRMAELMPAEAAARTQALLALACRKTERMQVEQWLRRRVELLADVTDLAGRRRTLWELWRPEAEL